jgi:tRNA 2-thiouridine synthesizing protein E
MLQLPTQRNMVIDMQTTPDGYLTDFDTWTPAVATELAQRDNLELTPAHWEVLHLLREFYATYAASPAMRTLIRAMSEKYGAEKGNSIYLHTLFPGGAAQQATKLAGLPKSIRCI